MDNCKNVSYDPYKLETQLLKAIEEDAKYKREDAAKFRAVEQCRNYEEFRDIVKASHIKPLEKNDSFQPYKIGSGSWNSTAKQGKKGAKCDKDIIPPMDGLEMQSEDDMANIPITQQNFIRYWISLNDLKKRLHLIHRVTSVDGFFKETELSADIIESLTKTLLESLEPKCNPFICSEDIDFVIKVMMCISLSSRFLLNLQFLNDDGKNIIKKLLEKVSELLEKETNAVHSREVLRQLTDKYTCWEDN